MIRKALHFLLGILDPLGPRRWQNKIVLIGISEMSADGQLLRQSQAWGRIVNAVPGHNFLIQLDGFWKGYFCSLPPDPRRFKVAREGDYTLRSTGETLNDPDFLATWIVDLETGAELGSLPATLCTADEVNSTG